MQQTDVFRGVFKTQSNIYDEEFFVKIIKGLNR